MGYYINQLPDGIREKAIANIKSQIGEGYLDFVHPRLDSVATAVKSSFRWNNSPEGDDFWYKVHIESPGYRPPTPIKSMGSMLTILGALGMMTEIAELLGEFDDVLEAPQEKQEQPQTSNVGFQEQSKTSNVGFQEQPQTSNVGFQEQSQTSTMGTQTKSKSITSDLRKVLLGVGINTANKTVYSDSRKQGVSVKVCSTYLTDDLRQEVKEKMEQLGYKYHSINVPSPNYAGYQGFSGTRFHFS